MKNRWIRGVAAAVVAAVVLSSAFVAHAGENKKEKQAAKEGEQFFQGEISSVDFKANTVTLKKKNAGTMTFACGGAKFYPKHKKTGGALADFKVGDHIEVEYTVQDGTPTASRLAEAGAHADHKENKAEKGK